MNKEYPAPDDDRKAKRDTNDIVSSEIGSGNNKSSYQIGKYNPDFWNNDNNVVSKNNCYAYACNICVDNIPDPCYRKYSRLVSSRRELEEGMEYDGLVKISDGNVTPRVQGTKDKPAWRVAVFATISGVDHFGYHFFREVWSGNLSDSYYFWAHKFHTEKVTNITYKEGKLNHLIRNPVVEMRELCNAKIVQPKYELVGYYLVKPDVKIGTP
ncbi:hypothetical protein [Photorhabdus laumondii]|uniref:Uncharacterized protein n=1 Tax=Photorhabdus laumondii subsp. clarkei TaxID=2029685 RepID=A0A329VBY2_9GAMM|nr:hypothetical protein [Photorhabdus laumondii]RAW85950.1 hypothetical protein CKY01_18755 [Photorhabdus laumondii subsp. clarkei]